MAYEIEDLVDDIKDELWGGLKKEVQDDADYSDDILEQKLIGAVREVIRARRYSQAGFSQKRVSSDIIDYYAVIRSLALYDYNQSGLEYESSHTENGTTRGFSSRRQLMSGVIPLAKRI